MRAASRFLTVPLRRVQAMASLMEEKACGRLLVVSEERDYLRIETMPESAASAVPSTRSTTTRPARPGTPDDLVERLANLALQP